MVLRASAVLVLISAHLFAASSPFDEAKELQRRGKLKEARDVLLAGAGAFRAAGDIANQAKALSDAGELDLSLGDYRGAIDAASHAASAHAASGEEVARGEDFNTIGLANLYLGNYAAALEGYQQALAIDRQLGRAEGEIARENNIGNVYYFQGRYMDAFRAYQSALDRVNATAAEPWNPRRRELTLANLATLYQRLGKEQTALGIYRQLAGPGRVLSPNEQAQMFVNQGVLYRRLGDPVKALQFYRRAQSLFAAEHHPSGEIGVLRNIGIALALDMDDLAGALAAFDAAVRLARQSSDGRGIVQANLYRATVLRRMARADEAEAAAAAAREGAAKAGLVEEQWKADYELGRLAEARGDFDGAASRYEAAIASFESVRTSLSRVSLRTEFLADKRDVYDALIELQLRRVSDATALFPWIERSRSRVLGERVSSDDVTLAGVQRQLAAETVFLDYWAGPSRDAVLWITPASAGVVILSAGADAIRDAVSGLLGSIGNRGGDWRNFSRILGRELLSGVPLARRVIVVSDGPLSMAPFEVLTDPQSGSLLIERHEISYLPSAQFLRSTARRSRWMPPWSIGLIAFGDPPAAVADQLRGDERWERLPASALEVQGIARLLGGRSRVHLGPDSRKRYLADGAAARVPLLHFATHALIDEENPDRSRILMASDKPGEPPDYLFEEEVYRLDLQGVDLATLSACDTARGKLIRGEGVEAFSRAFLASGAAATVTSLWRIPDQSSASFMQQFYYFLAHGETKAAALRSAKLALLHSNLELARPYYWAAFVLNGDGWNPVRRAIPWPIAGAAVLGVLAAVAFAIRWKATAKGPR